MLHKTGYGLVYNDDGSLCVTHQEDGAVAVEEGTTNLVNNPFFENGWTSWGVQNATNGSTRTIKEVEGAYGGKVAVLDRPAGGGNIGIYNGCGGGLAEGDIVTVSFRARRTKGTSDVGIRWGNGATHTVPISEEWGRYEITIPKDGNSNLIFEVHSGDSTIELDATQVETKPFATSFVDGSRPDGILAYPIALKDDYTIACYRKGADDTDYCHVAKRSGGKVFVDGVEDSEYDVGLIGGRNLAQGTNTTEWVPYTGARILFDLPIIRVESTRTSSGYFGIQQASKYRTINLEPDETYTLSFKARGNISRFNYVYIMNTGVSNQSISSSGAVKNSVESEEEFSEIQFSFTPNSYTANNGQSYIMISTTGDADSWFEIKEVKLEKGNKATDWTPAPEDLGYSSDLFMLSNHTGYIKDLKILPYIATDKEIKQMYSGGTFDVTDKGIVIADNYSEVGPMSGIIGWWPLDGHTDDCSGNNNHGTIVGATWGNGMNGKALEFDGTDDYVAITNISPITLSEFTLSAWVKITSHKLNYFLNFNINGALSSLPVLYSVANGRFGYWEGTNNYFGEVSLDTWYLLSVVRTSTEFLLYVNGSLASVVTGTHGPINLSQLHLGGKANYLHGSLCGVRIYDRTLSPEEIKILYNVTKPNAIPMQLSKDGTVYLSGQLQEV